MDIYKEIYDRNLAGETYILATIISTTGASPRRTGAKMLILPDAGIIGTIGGGTFEKKIIEDSLELLKSNSRHLLKRYSFSEKGKDTIGMACGGEATVFMEVNVKPNNLVIFGGGHICRELTRIASGSDFTITVVDDRREILDHYDSSINTILTDSTYHENFPPLDEFSHVVIVTKNHKCDHPVLEQAVTQKCSYIGMIGSLAKVKKAFSLLEESGVKKEQLENIHAPVGLDIGSEGPYEIAISILAEIIEVKHKLSQNKK